MNTQTFRQQFRNVLCACIAATSLWACGSNSSEGPPSEHTAGNGGGSVGGTAGSNPTPPFDPSLDDVFGPCDDKQAEHQLRRLSNFQINRSLRVLFPKHNLGNALQGLVGDNVWHGFDTIGKVHTMGTVESDGFMKVAEAVTERLNFDYPGYLECTGAVDIPCIEAYALDLAQRAFRRPLFDEEKTLLQGLITEANSEFEIQDAASMAVQYILQAPQFIYRADEYPDGKATSHDIAAYLSFSLWGKLPTPELRQWANEHATLSREQITAKVEEMVGDTEARTPLKHFADQWLALENVRRAEKDMDRFPNVTPSLTDSLSQSLTRLIEQHAFDSDNDLGELFTTRDLWVNQPMDAYYNYGGDSSWTLVQRPESQSAGILGHPGIMAAQSTALDSSPIFRGAYVRDRILCGVLPEPPAGVPELPDIKPGASVREVHEQHMAQPQCRACHEQIDPIGFAFENFDAIGKWRTRYEGADVDPTGFVADADDASGQFEDLRQFALTIGPSHRLRACMTVQMTRAMAGTTLEGHNQCAIRQIVDQFADQPMGVLDVFRSVAIETAVQLNNR